MGFLTQHVVYCIKAVGIEYYERTAGSIIEKQSKEIRKVSDKIKVNTPSVSNKSFFDSFFGGKKNDNQTLEASSADVSNSSSTTKTESSGGYIKYQIKSAKLSVKVDGKEQE